MKSALVFLVLVAATSSLCIWHKWNCNEDNGCGGFYGCSYGCEEGRCASSCMGACAAIEYGKYPEGCCTECKEWCFLEGSDGGDIAVLQMLTVCHSRITSAMDGVLPSRSWDDFLRNGSNSLN
uniref:Putative secretory peptide-30 n=1 Tax=Pleurobrachia bachei TaxID=34499 RepID=M4H1W0_PLEBA|nr:putative secretory peptide-30 [Pleurobrachia bachei]|eukprot:sb/3475908/